MIVVNSLACFFFYIVGHMFGLVRVGKFWVRFGLRKFSLDSIRFGFEKSRFDPPLSFFFFFEFSSLFLQRNLRIRILLGWWVKQFPKKYLESE